METQKVKIALFRSSWGSENTLGEWADSLPDYVRISEYETVDFKPLPVAEVAAKQVASLDAQIDTITTETLEKINKLKQQKAELLSLVSPT